MAPLEDLHSKDLAWISDFVMQQVVIMMRPMMDHLQQTDNSVDYAQRQVNRISMDLAEVKADVDRTNKYLAILRQGLGVQNEGKCVLQRSLESNTRTVKRLDEQMESLLTVLRGVEESFSQLCTDFRGANTRHEELSQKVSEHTITIDDLQAKVDRIEAPKDEGMNEPRIEVWHQLKELRNQISLVPKLEEKGKPPTAQSVGVRAEPWPKKSYAAVEVATPGSYAASSLSDATNTGSSHAKRISRVGSSSSRAQLLPQEHFTLSVPSRNPRVWSEDTTDDPSEEAHENARLPMLARPVARHVDRSGGTTEAPRLRFTATMQPVQPSRGPPSK
ncbi:unnamed protein product [Durusdinium trenchii]|uniref:Uncharacterized protein n=1 Tax=Durusdinium trenchii TaxID=1381693 RepID=A0ABP0J816_9DINO